jgi:hypothetical protein
MTAILIDKKQKEKPLYPLRSPSKSFYELPVYVIPFLWSSVFVKIPLDIHSEHPPSHHSEFPDFLLRPPVQKCLRTPVINL